MRLWKKVLLGVVAFVVLVVAAVLLFVGPWPTYSSGFENAGYYKKSLAAIDAAARDIKLAPQPAVLRAGWAVADITPETGTPLAGFGERKGKPSIGAHDQLHVKALALGDGEDTAIIVGADMLLVPDTLANAVRKAVKAKTPLKGTEILFTASHTHSGPGGFAPGLAMSMVAGKYNPAVASFLAQAFTDAILKAYDAMQPARMAHGGVDASAYIRNRTRDAGVDPELSYAIFERDGKRCYLTSFSAHPTTLGGDSFLFTADYPGFLQQAVEQATGGTAIYLGGALGSMTRKGDDGGADGFERAKSYGEKLARLILDNSAQPKFTDYAEVASIGAPITLPPLQVRLGSANWRLSPFVGTVLGIPRVSWMQAVRVGDVVFVGVPGDFSGEISASWKAWASARQCDLWTTSFCAGYAGYISPDRYYGEVLNEKGNMAYETDQMSWAGPHQEAFFTELMHHLVGLEMPATQTATASGSSPNG